MISIRKIKLIGESVLASFELIFKSCLQSWTFTSEWLKRQVAVQKRGSKQFLENHWLISLLLFLWQNIWTTDIQQNNCALKTIWYLITNQSLNLGINVSTTVIYYPWYIYIYILMWASKLKVCFLAYEKPLLRFGIKVSFIQVIY